MEGEDPDTQKEKELLFVWSAPSERGSAVGQQSTVADVTHTYVCPYAHLYLYIYIDMCHKPDRHWREKFTKVIS